MPSSYTPSLRLTLPVTGELAGSWGSTVNTGVTSLAEAAIAGTSAVAMTDADYTLTTANGATDQARNMFITLTGTLTVSRNVICPSVSKLYVVTNSTTGSQNIVFKTSAGAGITIANGQRKMVYCNGTDVLDATTSFTSIIFDAGTVSAPSITFAGSTNTGFWRPAVSTVALSTAGSERLRVTAGGNVGILTTTPARKLHVAEMDAGYGIRVSGPSGDNAWAGGIEFYSNNGTSITSSLIVSSNGMLFNYGGSERMRLDASGNFLVGKTTAGESTGGNGTTIFTGVNAEVAVNAAGSTSGTTGLALYSSGAAAFRFYVNMAGTVFATSTTISAISDQRLKENIRDLDVGLNAVLSLKPRVYDWKEGKGKDIKGDRGFIAQEFEQVFPDLIDEWKDPAAEGESPYKSVRPDLIPVLVKAIQEQQALITSLTARVAALEAV